MMFNNLTIQAGGEQYHIGRGLGQGWGISCLLFNIFTDDLTDDLLAQKNLFPQIFADDTNILGTTIEKLTQAITITEKWAEKKTRKSPK